MSPEEAYRRVRDGDWSPELTLACEAWAQRGAERCVGPLVPIEALEWVVRHLEQGLVELEDPGTFDVFVMGLGAAAAAQDIEAAMAENGREERVRTATDELGEPSAAIVRRIRSAVKAWLDGERLRTKLLALLTAPRAERGEAIERLLELFTERVVDDHLRPLYAALRAAAGLKPRWLQGPLDAKRLRELIRRLAALDVTRTALWRDVTLTEAEATELGLTTDLEYLRNHDRASARRSDEAVRREFRVSWRGGQCLCQVLDASPEGVGVRWPVLSGEAPVEGDRVWFLVDEERIPAKVMNRQDNEVGFVRLGLFMRQGLTAEKLGLEVGP